jgi:hypothetical protein
MNIDFVSSFDGIINNLNIVNKKISLLKEEFDSGVITIGYIYQQLDVALAIVIKPIEDLKSDIEIEVNKQEVVKQNINKQNEKKEEVDNDDYKKNNETTKNSECKKTQENINHKTKLLDNCDTDDNDIINDDDDDL